MPALWSMMSISCTDVNLWLTSLGYVFAHHLHMALTDPGVDVRLDSLRIDSAIQLAPIVGKDSLQVLFGQRFLLGRCSSLAEGSATFCAGFLLQLGLLPKALPSASGCMLCFHPAETAPALDFGISSNNYTGQSLAWVWPPNLYSQ